MVACVRCGRESPNEFGFCPGCGAPLAPVEPPREVRKVVTILFCDLTSSTAIGDRTDPEALRALMNRYYETARVVLERHGGIVEKFVGDAVMAVFGIPVTREDDALRATRASVELREVVHAIGLEARIGVNTGAVVAGDGDTLVTGDAVNVAARLEQAAGPGEVLLGDETVRLVRDAVVTEHVQLLLKGKPDPVAAHRLVTLDATAAGYARRLDRPMVGRERERARLTADFEDAAASRTCRMFTLIGPAGVGKSRLAADFLERVGEAGVIARGRALSYGEGITYWPLVEVLLQLGIDPAEAVRSSPADTQLATRGLLERVAEASPLVIVLDDLQWAEPPLLDLVEHVADWSREAPIFLLCIARPELLDARAGWGGGKLNSTSILLEPLGESEASALTATLLDGVELDSQTRNRILATAEGNPLFLEEMAALARDADGAVEVPPTIQALLQARLDTLDERERSVIQRGSVEGQVFHRGAVVALADETWPAADVAGGLLALVRKELVRPDKTQLPNDDAFRFRHLLIRDTAYEALPKAVRAELHERFADWLTEHGKLLEQDEIVGHHLEQAARYRGDLDRGDPRAAELAGRAAERLGAAGCAAFEREDMYATRALLLRAVGLRPRPDDSRALPYLLYALLESGDERLTPMISELELGSDRDRALALAFHVMSSPMGVVEDTAARLEAARAMLAEAGDLVGAACCDLALAFTHWGECQAGRAHVAYGRAYDLIRHGGMVTLERRLLTNLALSAIFAGKHVDAIRVVATELDGEPGTGEPLVVATVRSLRARMDYVAGVIEFAALRAAIDDEISLLEQTGSLAQAAWAKNFVRDLGPWLEGDAVARERGCREMVLECEERSPIFLPNALGQWACALCALNDRERALEAVARAREISSDDDVADQIVLDAADAHAHALAGDGDAAVMLLERARGREDGIDMAIVTDLLDHVDATVRVLLGDGDRARALLTGLIERSDARGRHRFADRYRRDLEALG